jgi:hypothetical protein
MRLLLALAASLLLPFAAAEAKPAGEEERYVPRGVWQLASNEEDYEAWFGRQLRAMNEPVLRRPQDRGRFRSRFRMLVLPSFQPAYAVRVDVRGTGDALVRTVELSGAGGYSPGHVARQRTYRLDKEDVEALFSAIEAAELRDLDADFRWEAVVPDGEPAICVDGVQYVFELAERAGSRFVTRDWCELGGELTALIRTVERLRTP